MFSHFNTQVIKCKRNTTQIKGGINLSLKKKELIIFFFSSSSFLRASWGAALQKCPLRISLHCPSLCHGQTLKEEKLFNFKDKTTCQGILTKLHPSEGKNLWSPTALLFTLSLASTPEWLKFLLYLKPFSTYVSLKPSKGG